MYISGADHPAHVPPSGAVRSALPPGAGNMI